MDKYAGDFRLGLVATATVLIVEIKDDRVWTIPQSRRSEKKEGF